MAPESPDVVVPATIVQRFCDDGDEVTLVEQTYTRGAVHIAQCVRHFSHSADGGVDMRLWVDTISRSNPRVPHFGLLTEKLGAQRRSRAEAIARRGEFSCIAQAAAREYSIFIELNHTCDRYKDESVTKVESASKIANGGVRPCCRRGADVDHDDLLSPQPKRSDWQASTEAWGCPQPKRSDSLASTEAGGSPQPKRSDSQASAEAGGSPQPQRSDTQASTETWGSPQPQRSDSQASTEAGGSPQPQRSDSQASREAGDSDLNLNKSEAAPPGPSPTELRARAARLLRGARRSGFLLAALEEAKAGAQVMEEALVSSEMCQASGILGLPTCWFQLASGR
jgi:hypothetical protein